jgi:rfaE bifunctional protein kinase chain/domain
MNKERFSEIVKKFKGKKIAVIGDVALDAYVYGAINRLNPESAALLLTVYDEQEEHRLGCAGNTAMNVSSLGGEVTLYCVIGNDSRGEIFRKLCEKNNIKLVVAIEGETMKKQRWFEKSHNYYLFRTDYGESNLQAISEKSQEELLSNLMNNNFDAIIFSDYNKRIFKGDFVQKVISWANSKNIFSVADAKPANALKFKGVKVIRPNEKEARQMVDNGTGMKIEELSLKLKEVMESRYCVITRGKEGVATCDGGFHAIGTKARKVSDVSGAGDTFAAALTLSLINGADIIEAANIANYASGIVVEKPGTATASNEELIKRISEEE